MNRALVIGDADLPARSLWERALRGADLVLAADGGANRALEVGIRVDWVVGDLDGILPSTLKALGKARVKRDADPDHTDLEKCLRFLVRRKVGGATLVGFLGNRLDHTLGTLAALEDFYGRIRLTAVDDDFVTMACRGRLEFRAPARTMVSLVSPGGATGVSTSGLRFALKNRDLAFSSLGIHNEVVRNPVRVRVRSGTVFVMRSHVLQPHA